MKRQFNLNFFRNYQTYKLHRHRAGICGLALLALLIPGCNFASRQADIPGPRDNVTAEEVRERTASLIGKTVTIRDVPNQKLSPNTFTMRGEEWFNNEPILVVNATGKPFVFPAEQTEVQATGEVRQFVIADVEREYGFDLDNNLYVDYEGRPAIIAQSMAPAPEPGEITSDPAQFYNRRLAVTGEIENITGQNTFTLEENQFLGGQDLLVLNVPPTTNTRFQPQRDQTVAVTGVLRPFVVAELERDYDFDWDLSTERELEAEYSRRPVLVAQTVYPSAIPEE
jgi:hypothetical protein